MQVIPANAAPTLTPGAVGLKDAYFPYIEGLRGLSAFYVVLYHIYHRLCLLPGAPYARYRDLAVVFSYGHYAVAVFIVISGYCLAAPLVRHPERGFDAGTFFLRRARRILPAYYAALLLAVAVYGIGQHVIRGHDTLRHFSTALGLHVLLLHNLARGYHSTLDAPMWSTALEVQIYVVFAVVLVPIWKRYGIVAQLAVALALGLVPHFLFHGKFDYTAAWFLGLFGMGVAAAASARRLGTARWTVPLTLVVLVVGAVAMIRAGDPSLPGSPREWPADLLVGAAVALFLANCATGRFIFAARALSLWPLTALGAFSYSLYLVHGPIVGLTSTVLARRGAPGPVWLLAYACLIPLLLALAYALYRVAERPFMSKKLRAGIDSTTHGGASNLVLEV